VPPRLGRDTTAGRVLGLCPRGLAASVSSSGKGAAVAAPGSARRAREPGAPV